jgi:hypothetical protein
MLTIPELIYCSEGGPKLVEIAVRNGMKYGIQLPNKTYGKLYFADQDWKNPNRTVYMKSLEFHKPKLATVLDLEQRSQLATVLDWAEEASQYVNNVLIIPKVKGIIKSIPKRINGKEIILAFSIPTTYGETPVSPPEFKGWKVHLLGGKPSHQFTYWYQMSKYCEVESVDGNYFRMKATRFCEYWESPGRWIPDGGKTARDAYLSVFEKSVKNLIAEWNLITGNALPETAETAPVKGWF